MPVVLQATIITHIHRIPIIQRLIQHQDATITILQELLSLQVVTQAVCLVGLVLLRKMQILQDQELRAITHHMMKMI